MVGRVGYAPTTPAMSMQYSTIELTARFKSFIKDLKRAVSSIVEYCIDIAGVVGA